MPCQPPPEMLVLSLWIGALLAFLTVAGAAWTGWIYRTFPTPMQLSVFAVFYLLISFTLGHLIERGNLGLGIGVATGGLVAVPIAVSQNRGRYVAPFLILTLAGSLIAIRERRERPTT